MYKQYRLACAMAVLAISVVISTVHADKARLTSHKDMMSKLASLDMADDDTFGHGRMKVLSIGKSVNGKDIPLVVISDSEVSQDLTKRLFIVCRQHGDEPASTEAMLKLIEDLVVLSDEGTADLLTKVSFFVVPMMNPDGADRYIRRNANGADLNRDWLALSQPETLAVRAAIDSVSPDIILDEHELSPTNRSSDFVETAGPKSGVPSEFAAESAQLQSLVVGMLRTHDIQVTPYLIDDHNPARLAHRYFPIHAGTKTMLFESRQAGVRQYQLQYRMNLHIVGTMTIAKYLAGRGDELWQRVAAYDEQQRYVRLASRSRKSGSSAGKSTEKKK